MKNFEIFNLVTYNCTELRLIFRENSWHHWRRSLGSTQCGSGVAIYQVHVPMKTVHYLSFISNVFIINTISHSIFWNAVNVKEENNHLYPLSMYEHSWHLSVFSLCFYASCNRSILTAVLAPILCHPSAPPWTLNPLKVSVPGLPAGTIWMEADMLGR